MNFDFFRDLYKLELDGTRQLTASLALPTGIGTLIGSLLGGMATKFPWGNWASHVVFVALFIFACVALMIAVVYLARSFWGSKSQYIPRAAELHDWYNLLLKHYQDHGDDSSDPVASARQDFENGLMERLAAAATFNAEENDRLRRSIFMSRAFLLLALLLTALTAIPHSLMN